MRHSRRLLSAIIANPHLRLLMNPEARLPTRRPAPSPARAAAALLAKHWDGKLPVDPHHIATALGIRVVPRGGPEDPGYAYSGYFDNSGAQPVIEYNRTESPVRQRFTLAHELGHYALGHASSPRDTPENFSTGVSDKAERLANRFAAELLMPAKEFRVLLQAGRLKNIAEFADAFWTSQLAITYRMQSLGIIP
jgi:Zn-dependent peptidase ImmA (M78 family)